MARLGWSRRQIAEDRELSLGVVGKYARGIKFDSTAPIRPAAVKVPADISDHGQADLRSLIARLQGAKPERQEESVKPSASPQLLNSSKEISASPRPPRFLSEDGWLVYAYRKVCDLITRTSQLSIVQENPGRMDYFYETKRLFEVTLERRGLTHDI